MLAWKRGFISVEQSTAVIAATIRLTEVGKHSCSGDLNFFKIYLFVVGRGSFEILQIFLKDKNVEQGWYIQKKLYEKMFHQKIA